MSSNYTPWERVQISRSAERPTSLDYISTIFERYMSLHGDRYFGDDKAIVGGLASIGGRPVTVIGQQKGRSTKENIKRNFGMPSPEGYRKSLRLMKQAEKFHRPIILFVDTPGAFCGLEAEEGEVYFDEVKDFAECGLCGTAAVISPVGKIVDHGKEICFPSGMEKMGPVIQKLYDTLTGIQMGRIQAPEGWLKVIE